LRRSQEGLKLLRFIQVWQLTYRAHKAVKEKLTLLHEHTVFLVHGLLVRDRGHIQAEETRVKDLAEEVELTESAENFEFSLVISASYLVNVMRTILDGRLRD
jgi:hypothetical protein